MGSMESKLEHITLRWSASLFSFRSAGFQPAGGQDGRSPRRGATPIPSQAVWCRPVSFPTSAYWHDYNFL